MNVGDMGWYGWSGQEQPLPLGEMFNGGPLSMVGKGVAVPIASEGEVIKETNVEFLADTTLPPNQTRNNRRVNKNKREASLHQRKLNKL